MKKALDDYYEVWDKDFAGNISLEQVAMVASKLQKDSKKTIAVPDGDKKKVGKEEMVQLMLSSIPEEIAKMKPEEAAAKIRETTAEVKSILTKMFGRRNHLIAIEKKVQAAWAKEGCNVSSPEDAKKEKFFCTFPYPYMNGKLHLGHAFTLCKAEFAARFQRINGKQVLFPFGFHCTGMPIAACAEKLAKEMAMYGNPPKFPSNEPEPQAKKEEKKKVKDDAKGGKGGKGGKGKKGKGKAAKKKSKKKYQWEILEEMGVPSNIVHKFADPLFWLDYFPPIAIDDLKELGVMVDWRRSFITTDANPYYDAFVRWQFAKLRAAEKVELAKRMCVFSPSNGQPCADHDRAEGEGVGPQEYTLIKIKVCKPYPEALTKALGSAGESEVFLAAATLRPETMYGQTNCWLLPTGDYSLVKMDSGDIFVCSARSALNMSFQELSGVPKKPVIIGSVKGADLLGMAIAAPLCKYEKVYTMPLLTISMGKGTGVVTSVPSDAPADYAAWMDMKKDAAMRKKYGITEEMVAFDVVPIIDTPLEGAGEADRKLPAPYLCKKMKIKSQKAVDKLEEAKKICYKISNAKGTMLVGAGKGLPVMEAKEVVKKMMIDKGQAVTYYEPQEKVVARAGNEECVCALTEQWFLKYGENVWQKKVADHIEGTLDCYSNKAKDLFRFTIGWLRQWACSRTAGLGTRLPWDTQYLIESLSDSTIYMAYYTIAHFFQGGTLDGGEFKQDSNRIQPEDLTEAVFDYVFASPKASVPLPDSKIPAETLQKMRKEFLYWYPLDLRVSGKDLIRNHLTMSLYNHAAIWDQDSSMWPQSFFTNGHVQLNNEKMSKSTGNFMTLEQAVRAFGSDACRLALAEAGDGLEDSNFTEDTADRAILKLTTLEDWVKEQIQMEKKLRSGPMDSFFDRSFDNEINAIVHLTYSAYSEMRFRDVVVHAFYGMLSARDWYREYVSKGMHVDLVKKFVKVVTIILAPICPHFCENLWTTISAFVGTSGRVVTASWPDVPGPDKALTAQTEYLRRASSSARSTLAKQKKKLKGKTPNVLKLDVSTVFPEWKKFVMTALKTSHKETGELLDNKSLATELRKNPELCKNKKMSKLAMSYAAMLKNEFKSRGAGALESEILFDEVALLEESKEYLMKGTSFNRVDIGNADNDPKSNAEPGKPAISFLCEE
eukprot:CAMPEP_0197519170 /NCGR_PEP_ID=MMETSP1318-20131121/4439_1 /TAXON_ID=552666 /ORGANISM="Partenskyella glossopodia, Strain RCC365" /LENGTH=1168 /DNA_ID=CAMNT_0043070003 /DNA_START=14 /DNA_END=3520 /DNA_ORIENTATION=+